MPSDTKAKFLQAGTELLLEDAIRMLDKAVSIERLADRTGISRETFHKQYRDIGGKSKFIDDLIAALPTRIAYAAEELSEKIKRELVTNNEDFRQAVRNICKWDFENLVNSQGTRYLYLALTFSQDDARFMRKVRSEYQEITVSVVQAYEAVLARLGAKLRAPFTVKSLAVALTAVADGLTQRRLVEPEAVPDTLYSDIVIAVIASVVDVEQTNSHIDDLAAPLANRLREVSEHKAEKGQSRDWRPIITNAAREEFSRRGYFATTPDHIAAQADVSRLTLTMLFPNTSDIAVYALKKEKERLAEHAMDAARLHHSEKEIIEGYLLGLTDLALANIAYMEALVWDGAVKQAVDLPSVITPVIEAGQHSGVIKNSVSPGEVASFLTDALLVHCFTHQQQTAENIAKAVSSMCLDGIFT